MLGGGGPGSAPEPRRPDLLPITSAATRVAWRLRLSHDSRAVPTYDYLCRACGSQTEVIHSMLEDGPSICERCGGNLRRVLFPTGIIFKGSGFYRNDSRPSTSSSTGGGDSATSSGSDGAAASGSKTDADASSSDPKTPSGST